MEYKTKEFIALMISCALFACASLSHRYWGWPTNTHLFYVSCIWLVAACISGAYSWHLETKDEV